MKFGFKYPNPPITEALIDIRVELPASIQVGDLEAAWSGFEADYPIKKSQHAAKFEGRFSGMEASVGTSSSPAGFLYLAPDERQVYQTRLDGFTYNRLAPYDGWGSFRNEARRLWDAYRTACKPARITRLAVRYVNRIDIPLPVHELKGYLRTVPEVSSDLPYSLAGYFMQLKIPQDDLVASLLLNQAVVEPSRSDVVSIVLDIDIFRISELPINEEILWDILDLLRIRKNEVFEACITDRTRELFSNASHHK